MVADIVGYPIDQSIEAIIQALDDYLEEQEDDDIWYSFHEFIEDREGCHHMRQYSSSMTKGQLCCPFVFCFGVFLIAVINPSYLLFYKERRELGSM